MVWKNHGSWDNPLKNRQTAYVTIRGPSADDKLITFFPFSQKTGSDFGDNLHEKSNPVFWEK